MIKATELRVNNWVTITGSSIQLTGPKLAFIFNEDGLITRCEPIPLTAELLEKAGFDQYKPYHFRYDKGIKQPFDVSCVNSVWWFSDYYHAYNYVHELQNLFFACTSKELEITLS